MRHVNDTLKPATIDNVKPREKVTIGTYPAFTIKQARDRHGELRALAERGQSPAKAKRVLATARKLTDSQRPSFRTFAQRWVDADVKTVPGNCFDIEMHRECPPAGASRVVRGTPDTGSAPPAGLRAAAGPEHRDVAVGRH